MPDTSLFIAPHKLHHAFYTDNVQRSHVHTPHIASTTTAEPIRQTCSVCTIKNTFFAALHVPNVEYVGSCRVKQGFFPKFCPDSIKHFQFLSLVVKEVKHGEGHFGPFFQILPISIN